MDNYSFYSNSLQNNTFSTLFVGRNIVTLERIDSTNNYLKNLLSKSAPVPDGTVIMAVEQYAGRGQVNNTWVSEPGKNLTFSLLLSPAFLSPDLQFMLNKTISIAINDVLTEIIGAGVKIKWPNDIYFKDRKLGGVLIENILRGKNWTYAIIGIGLNINQSGFPDDIKKVTSLNKILHQDYDLHAILRHLCKSIEQRYQQLRDGRFELINKLYLETLYKFGEYHTYEINGLEIQGKISGINNQGMLEVEIEGTIKAFNFKEISFVNP